jgi:signal transduction histidine kinase
MIDDAASVLASLPREELVERARALQTVLRVVRDVAAARTLHEIAERFVEAVAAYTRFPALVVYRALPSRDGFEVLARHGFDDSKFPPGTILPWQGSLTGRAATLRQVLTTEDIASDERVDPATRVALAENAYASGACVPILWGTDVLGSFNLVYARGTTLRPNERSLFETLATTLGAAMAQLIAMHRERELEAQALRAQQLESVGVLAGGIAHDFNNLLTGIIGNVELALSLAKESGNTEVAELLSEALAATERAKTLVKQLLTFSRAGVSSTRVTGDLASLVREVSSFAARGTSVRLDVVIEEPLGAVEIDPSQIGQVFQNLVLNACQASERGSTVTIQARRITRESGQQWVVVEVIDRGTGISSDRLPHIFEPFVTGRPGGTGLGLALIRSIVQRHGGNVLVKSEVGVGSTFTVELPVSSRAPARRAEVAEGVAAFSGRALVLDDEQMVRRIVEMYLAQLGFEVQSAGHGDEAIELARHAAAENRPFRVALLDLTIVGGRSGSEIAPDLRRISPSTRLVASSGYASAETSGSWDATLPKPYKLADLSAALERALDKH